MTSTDDQIVRVRPNSDEGSELPLQIELTKASPEKSKYSAATYQIDVPEAGLYTFRLHAKGADANVNISVGDKATDVSLSGHVDEWTDYAADIELAAGKSSVKITNSTEAPVLLNSWNFKASDTDGLEEVAVSQPEGVCKVYSLQGVFLGTASSLKDLNGVFIVVAPDGTNTKLVK